MKVTTQLIKEHLADILNGVSNFIDKRTQKNKCKTNTHVELSGNPQ